MIAFRALPWMNQKYVAFGKLIEGATTLDRIETAKVSFSGRPADAITVAKCGKWSPAA